MQVPKPSMQHRVMIEAVENHMPEVVIVDEIGTEAEAIACRSIAERGVMLIGTAHGERLENIIKNPTLADLVRDFLCLKDAYFHWLFLSGKDGSWYFTNSNNLGYVSIAPFSRKLT